MSNAAAAPGIIRHAQVEDFTVYQPAGYVLRWYALTLDLTFAAPLDVAVHMPFARLLERLAAYDQLFLHHALAALLTAIPLLVYFIAPTVLYGQTLGKRIVGLRVVRGSFNPHLSVGQVILRETVGKALTIMTFGLTALLPESAERKRAMHDHLAETQVITYRQR